VSSSESDGVGHGNVRHCERRRSQGGNNFAFPHFVHALEPTNTPAPLLVLSPPRPQGLGLLEQLLLRSKQRRRRPLRRPQRPKLGLVRRLALPHLRLAAPHARHHTHLQRGREGKKARVLVSVSSCVKEQLRCLPPSRPPPSSRYLTCICIILASSTAPLPLFVKSCMSLGSPNAVIMYQDVEET
jgi:hypothetical protein